MCGGNYEETSSNMSDVKLPKVRSISKVAKDGVVFVRNTGYGFMLELADTEAVFTKAEQELAEGSFMYEDGFTKAGNPILTSTDIDEAIALALLNSQGLARPRKGTSVRIG